MDLPKYFYGASEARIFEEYFFFLMFLNKNYSRNKHFSFVKILFPLFINTSLPFGC